MISLLILFHEATHIKNDNDRVEKLLKGDTDEFWRSRGGLLGGLNRLSINDEVKAYAFEIEVLNIITEGLMDELGQEVGIPSNHPSRLKKIKEKLGLGGVKLNERQESYINMMSMRSMLYFPERIQKGHVPPMFAHNILHLYPQCSFATDAKGKIVPKWLNKEDEANQKGNIEFGMNYTRILP
jgi:hypothetical protein